MRYHVTQYLDIEADSPEAAAIEFDRLGLTTRPKELSITEAGEHNGGTVFLRVVRGEVKRVA
jgi:hypothetical protein